MTKRKSPPTAAEVYDHRTVQLNERYERAKRRLAVRLVDVILAGDEDRLIDMASAVFTGEDAGLQSFLDVTKERLDHLAEGGLLPDHRRLPPK